MNTQKETVLIAGYCHSCKKAIYSNSNYHVLDSQTILCEDCKRKRDANILYENKKSFNKSLWIGGVVGVLALIVSLVIGFQNSFSPIWTILISLLLGVGGFTFVSQLFWEGFIFYSIFFFLKTFKAPGLIFTLDLDGIVWFICVKLLFGILGFILSASIFLFGLAFCMICSLFTFPFAFIKRKNELK